MHPNSSCYSIDILIFFVSDGVILRSVVSLVGQVCEVLLIVLAFQPSCAEEWVPYLFCTQNMAQVYHLAAWKPPFLKDALGLYAQDVAFVRRGVIQ